MFLLKPICLIILGKFSTTLFSNVLLGAFTLAESDVAFGWVLGKFNAAKIK